MHEERPHEILAHRYLDPRWRWPDPPPPWVRLDDAMIKQWTQMEFQFRAREIALEQEKLEAFGKIMGVQVGRSG